MKFKSILVVSALTIAHGMAGADDYTDLVGLVAPQTVRQAAPAVTAHSAAKSSVTTHSLLDGISESMAVASQLRCLDRMMGNDQQPIIGEARNHFLGYAPQSYSGKFFRPVFGGVVTSRFGYRPAFKRIHNGIDISLNVGDTVRAALSGVVTKVAYESGGYGNYVVLSHPDGVETRYAHLSRSIVTIGDRVVAGDAIALGGNTGNSTGPHLHFEARVLGTPVDPDVMFDLDTPGISTPSNLLSKPLDESMAVNAMTRKKIAKGDLKPKRTYVVRQGDTPATVAARAGISVLDLCRLNMIKADDNLEVGRMIKLK